MTGYQIGRFQPDFNLGSQSNHGIARTWLRNCQDNHPNCLKSDISELPTRVIDVGTGENAQTLQLIQSRGRVAQYVTLSHCWGGDISYVLTTKTLEQFQEGISLHDLPANFRDAVVITRELGIRYLWIDSLCIVQDSKQDWEQKFKRMGDFYSNSTLTISAISSENKTSGILRCEDKFPRPRSAQLCVHPDSEESGQVTIEGITDEDESLESLDRNGPLALRGWALQESLLSPRQLIYGNRQIYWKCPNDFESADGLPIESRISNRKYRVISSLLYRDRLIKPPKGPINLEELFQEYCDLVQTYSSKKLTYASDKLPAFSGLAQRIHARLPGQYLAGIWSHDFHRGLCWCLATPKTRLPAYRAPSWSWASTNEQVMYFGRRKFKPDAFRLQLLGYDVHLRDESNPYGEIKRGCAIVQGYTRPLVTHAQVGNHSGLHIHGTVVFDELGGSWNGKAFSGTAENDNNLLWFDDEVEPDAYISKEYVVLLLGRYYTLPLREEEDEEGDEDEEGGVEGDEGSPENDESEEDEDIAEDNEGREDEGANDNFYGLILRDITNSEGNEYERVGYVTFDSSISLAWVRKWENRVLKLI